MQLSTKIAARYLLARKSGNISGWITLVSAIGMAVGTAALIIILSTFNGFEKVISSNLDANDPDFIIRPKEGKFFVPKENFLFLEAYSDSVIIDKVLRETVMMSYDGRQAAVTAVGTDNTFGCTVTPGIAEELGIRPRGVTPTYLRYPKRGKNISLTNPASSMEEVATLPRDIIDGGQDGDFVAIHISRMRQLLQYDHEVSEVRISFLDSSVKLSKDAIEKVIDDDNLVVLNRLEQRPELYKMMSYERIAIFLILIFVVIIVAFNLFSGLRMLIIEKKEDSDSLRAMGIRPSEAKDIFKTAGYLTTLAGLAAGLVAGIVLTLLQARFGIVKMPGNSLISAYPVDLRILDVVLTFSGVALVGWVVSWSSTLPFSKLSDSGSASR